LWQKFELSKTGLNQLIIAVGAEDGDATASPGKHFFGQN